MSSIFETIRIAKKLIMFFGLKKKTVSSIKCYQCKEPDPRCRDPFQNDTAFFKPCPPDATKCRKYKWESTYLNLNLVNKRSLLTTKSYALTWVFSFGKNSDLSKVGSPICLSFLKYKPRQRKLAWAMHGPRMVTWLHSLAAFDGTIGGPCMAHPSFHCLLLYI